MSRVGGEHATDRPVGPWSPGEFLAELFIAEFGKQGERDRP